MSFIKWLTLLLIGLKLTGYIDWAWAWVLAPLWIPLAMAAVLFCFVASAKILTD